MKNKTLTTVVLASLFASGCASSWKADSTPFYAGERKPLEQVAHVRVSYSEYLGEAFSGNVPKLEASIDSLNGKPVPEQTSSLEVVPGDYNLTAQCRITRYVPPAEGTVFSSRATIRSADFEGSFSIDAGQSVQIVATKGGSAGCGVGTRKR